MIEPSTEMDGAGEYGPAFRPSPSYFANPYLTYQRLRNFDPVHRSGFGPWLVSRYEDCQAILRDPRCIRDKNAARGPQNIVEEPPDFFARMRQKWMVYRDPPDHTRLRRLFNKAFSPRMVQGLVGYIAGLSEFLLNIAEAQGQLEVVSELSFPLPIGAIAEMLGVPSEERNQFRAWSRDIALGVDLGAAPERVLKADQAAQEMHAYFSELIAQRARRPREDLLSALLAAAEDEDRLNREEMVANCVLLLFAGHETTSHYLTNGILALLDHPAELRKLRAEPGLLKSAGEELLRYEAPLQLIARFAVADMAVAGHPIRRGEQLVLLIGAANRDERAFPDPNRLDLTRAGNQVLTFGAGIHYCLGAPLARLEGQIVFEQILKRFPNLRLAADFQRQYRDTMAFRALRSLTILT